MSYARPGKLFTANQELITAQAGILNPEPFARIIETVVDILHTALRA
jgi:hypothetical protein